ncbi:hypothetical protein [Streptomyces sp. t39]|uniref:hypothetical protein n=1 Tax=Streptomyces sp. t39 TaxID=1828156 RepID=UPI0011CEB697|nr:hypothetical protein [Streptomyces sp. t39]TXS51420.1 hypothetical protein EAO77_26515 [Streptomyces sp. t39]
MFRRTFWFTAGVGAGVWATTKVNRKLKQLTPESLAAQAADKAIDAGHRLKGIAVDIRAQMAQREAELGEALGLNARSGLPPATRRPAVGPGRPAPVTRLHATDDDPRRTTENTTEDPGTGTSYNRNEDH